MTYRDNGYRPRVGYSQQFALCSGDPLADGLIHFYKLEEASGDRADAIGSYALSPSGAPSNTTGLIGNAASFVAGTSDRLVGTGNMSEKIHTWACWIKLSATATSMFLGQETWGATLRNNELFFAGTYVYARADSAVAYSQAQWDHSGLIDDGSWHCIMGSCLGTSDGGDGKAYLYVDDPTNERLGSRTGSPLTTVRAPNDSFAIGGGPSTFLTCAMDCVALWNRQLSQAERLAFWNSGSGWEP